MRPPYIPKPVWDSMTWKEQDFVVLLRAGKYTKSEIKRRLYITTDQGYGKLRNRVAEKIRRNAVSEDIA